MRFLNDFLKNIFGINPKMRIIANFYQWSIHVLRTIFYAHSLKFNKINTHLPDIKKIQQKSRVTCALHYFLHISCGIFMFLLALWLQVIFCYMLIINCWIMFFYFYSIFGGFSYSFTARRLRISHINWMKNRWNIECGIRNNINNRSN